MARTDSGRNGAQAGQKTEGPNKRKGIRTADDLELIKLILEENPRLKSRVLYVLETALGKRTPEE